MTNLEQEPPAVAEVVAPPGPEAVEEPAQRRRRASVLSNFLERYGVVLALLVIVAGFSVLRPHTYFTTSNLLTTVSAQGVILILAVASAFPLRLGRFDFSLANIMVLTGALVGNLTVTHHVGLGEAIVIGMLCALLCGLINGFLVEVIGIDSFIATLGSSFVYGGIAYALTSGQLLVGFPSGISSFARHDILSLPVYVWLGWLVAAIAWLLFELSAYGRQILFVGGNRAAADLVGIPILRLSLLTYIGAGAVAGFAGLMLVGSLGSLDPTVGNAYLLPPLAAVFLGASTIQIGRINIIGTLVAVYLLSAGDSGLEIFGATAWVTQVFQGAALVVAVGIAAVIRRRRMAGA